MKKIFFFLILFFPIFVSAGSIEDLEIENGVLSREFESNNNTYSVLLNENEDTLKLHYELKDKNASVKIEGDTYKEGTENKATVNILNTDGTKEIYTFYLEKESITPVFQELTIPKETKKVILYLPYYVGGGCFLIIIFLFKIIVLGFKKRK